MPLVCFDCGKPIERHPERWSEDEPKRLVCEECEKGIKNGSDSVESGDGANDNMGAEG